MKTLREVLIAFLSLAALASGAAIAASTTTFSDQWWIPSESGWGASVQQQSSTLVINLMVYGADGKPTWLFAAAALQANPPAGHTVFLGDLYATMGPYYGGAFNPAVASERKVGTLTFDANTPNSATMSYTVDGTPVVKNVTRQTWSDEDLAGIYYVGWNADCGGVWRTLFDGPIEMGLNHFGGTVWIRLRNTDTPDPGIVFVGNYTQAGHMSQIVAEFASGSGSATFFEIEKTDSGFTGRLSGTITWQGVACQLANGRIGGVLVQ